VFWRKKKYIFVIEPKKKEAKKTGSRFVRVRNIVIIVLGLFLVISSVEYERHKIKRKQAALDIIRLSEMVEEFIWENGKCPESLESIIFSTGLRKNWEEEITDPWGKKYDMVCPGRKNTESADILSAGPDRSYYTMDDVKLN
jgi:hypothetical protein